VGVGREGSDVDGARFAVDGGINEDNAARLGQLVGQFGQELVAGEEGEGWGNRGRVPFHLLYHRPTNPIIPAQRVAVTNNKKRHENVVRGA